jgi:hypothetical protein
MTSWCRSPVLRRNWRQRSRLEEHRNWKRSIYDYVFDNMSYDKTGTVGDAAISFTPAMQKGQLH